MEETPADQVECPICQQKFDQETIERHVDKCLFMLGEKPVTRHQENKKQTTFFSKKNGKRGVKNDIGSTNVVNKKVKFNLDDEDETSTSSSTCAVGKSREGDQLCDTSMDDDVVVKKDETDNGSCNEILTSPKTENVNSFFNKRTWKPRKNEDTKTVQNNKSMFTSSIDLTDSTESENTSTKTDVDTDSIECVDIKSSASSTTSSSSDTLANSLDATPIADLTITDTNNTSFSENEDISLENFRSPASFFTKTSEKKVAEENLKRNKTNISENKNVVKLELNFKTKSGSKVKPSLPMLGSSPEFAIRNKAPASNFDKDSLEVLSVDASDPDSTPLKKASKKSKAECSPPPPILTTFQQELFNMSLGKDMTPSPPVNSNFRARNGNDVARKEKKTAQPVPPDNKGITQPVTPDNKGITQPVTPDNKAIKRSYPTKIPDTPDGATNGHNGERKSMKEKKEREIILGKLPLSEQMRPRSLDDYVGQVATSTQTLLKELFRNDRIPSMILWGPPGCGKTSLAHVISHQCKSGLRYRFVSLSATMSGVADVKEAVKIAKNEKRLRGKHTVLFIDEVHRFNKMQQDSFLPHIEDGTIVLIGATTENPSFHLNNALISRCRIVVLHQLDVDNIMKILTNALFRLGGVETNQKRNASTDPRFMLEDGVVKLLADYSNGDARIALTSLDLLLQAKLPSNDDNSANKSVPVITCQQIKEELKRGHVNYDRKGDEHFDIISAFHKSIRGGEQDAAVYWLARMLEGGEEPLYIARRMVRIASEDIGIADPGALTQAVSTFQACQFIGMPECDVILAQAATYLANAPKSIAVYSAYKKAKSVIKECSGAQPCVPLHLRNAPTKLMKDLGCSKGYKYTPNFNGEEGKQDYLPKEIVGTTFFT